MPVKHTFRWGDGTKTEKINMGKAIRAHCAECYGFDDWVNGVRDCLSPLCALYPFRFGKDPGNKRTLSDQDRAKIASRFAISKTNRKKSDATNT